MAPQPRIVDILTETAKSNEGIRGKFKMAAGVVYKKTLIATGVNSLKSHPLMWKYGKNEEAIYLHAEIDAIKNALRVIDQDKLAKCDLYVVRVRNSTKKSHCYGLAKPCEGCQRAIETFGLARVFYSTYDGDMHCVERFEDFT